MTFGLRCSGPACRPHPASLPVRVPTDESLPPASFSFASRLHLAVRLRLPSSAPVGSFHPTRFCPCWAHPAGGLATRLSSAESYTILPYEAAPSSPWQSGDHSCAAARADRDEIRA